MANDKWRLINYFDVWGNEADGFEVNNACVEFDDLIITDEATDDDIIDYLIEIGFLSEKAKGNVRLESDWDWGVELYQKDNDYPIGRLERLSV